MGGSQSGCERVRECVYMCVRVPSSVYVRPNEFFQITRAPVRRVNR